MLCSLLVLVLVELESDVPALKAVSSARLVLGDDRGEGIGDDFVLAAAVSSSGEIARICALMFGRL